MVDGTQNNLSGMSLEHGVASICMGLGFNANARHMLDPSIGLAPHRTRTNLSVWVHPCELFPHGLGIDASSYNESGSAYQKVPYKIINAGGWKCPGLVILDGDGRGIGPMRRFAVEFVEGYPSCIGVFRLTEFKVWLADVKSVGKPVTGQGVAEIQQSLLLGV